jgi:hypothetical protein
VNHNPPVILPYDLADTHGAVVQSKWSNTQQQKPSCQMTAKIDKIQLEHLCLMHIITIQVESHHIQDLRAGSHNTLVTFGFRGFR